jgi:Mor family transcriptional regulator
MMKELTILDRKVLDYLNAFHVVLIDAAGDSVLPELVRVFGSKAVIRFLDVFAGMTVTVPSRAVIENSIRDMLIYMRLKKGLTVDRVTELSNQYDISEETVRCIYYRVKKLLEVVSGGKGKEKETKDQEGDTGT